MLRNETEYAHPHSLLPLYSVGQKRKNGKKRRNKGGPTDKRKKFIRFSLIRYEGSFFDGKLIKICDISETIISIPLNLLTLILMKKMRMGFPVNR